MQVHSSMWNWEWKNEMASLFWSRINCNIINIEIKECGMGIGSTYNNIHRPAGW